MSNSTKKFVEKAQKLIEMIGPELGCDFTYQPGLVDGRDDVCVVRHAAENGRDYGFDTYYLVWAGKDGQLHSRELLNSKSTKDYLNFRGARLNEGVVEVALDSGGAYSGEPWEDSLRIPLKELGL